MSNMAGARRRKVKVNKQRAPMGPIEMGAEAPRDDGTVGSVNRWALIADNNDDGERWKPKKKRQPKPAADAKEVVVAQEPPPLPAEEPAVHNKGEGKRKNKKKATASKVSEEADQQSGSGGGRCREVAERVCKAAVAMALVGLLCQFAHDTLVAAGSLAV